jgi:hypothetical protein
MSNFLTLARIPICMTEGLIALNPEIAVLLINNSVVLFIAK